MIFKEYIVMYKVCYWYLKYISIFVYGLIKYLRIVNIRNIYVYVLFE